MTTYNLTGQITPEGELQLTLPDGIQPGEVRVTLTVPSDLPGENPLSGQEIAELIHIEPKSGAEIVAGLGTGWEDMTVSGQEWVEQMRRHRREQNQW